MIWRKIFQNDRSSRRPMLELPEALSLKKMQPREGNNQLDTCIDEKGLHTDGTRLDRDFCKCA